MKEMSLKNSTVYWYKYGVILGLSMINEWAKEIVYNKIFTVTLFYRF